MERNENWGRRVQGEYLVINGEVTDEVELDSLRRRERARKIGGRRGYEA